MPEIFYRVTMTTYNGKKLYLKADTINCTWEFSNKDAIWFETEKEAKEFCNKYFKNFKNYEIEEFEY